MSAATDPLLDLERQRVAELEKLRQLSADYAWDGKEAREIEARTTEIEKAIINTPAAISQDWR